MAANAPGMRVIIFRIMVLAYLETVDRAENGFSARGRNGQLGQWQAAPVLARTGTLVSKAPQTGHMPGILLATWGCIGQQ